MGERHRLRSFAWFIIALAWFVAARSFAGDAANAVGNGAGAELVRGVVLLALLIFGYSVMGYIGQRQHRPIESMGLVRRPDWGREFALGALIGWAGIAVVTLIIAIFGGIVVVFFWGWHPFLLIPLDLLILAIIVLAQEVAFRGYAFQRLIEVSNPFIATLVMSLLFALLVTGNPGTSSASIFFAMFAGWLFSIAYLRTRALWVGWGIHFAWNAGMAVVFGLPLDGLTKFSPVISSTALGPTWLSGLDYGPEGSATGMIMALVLCLVAVRATRDLRYKYAQPVIIPGGIPVDIDAMARRQHEAAMGPDTPAPPQIVQIGGLQPTPQPPSGNPPESFPR